jgi:hypothetical protein
MGLGRGRLAFRHNAILLDYFLDRALPHGGVQAVICPEEYPAAIPFDAIRLLVGA